MFPGPKSRNTASPALIKEQKFWTRPHGVCAMYPIDERDQATELRELPPPVVGAPLPVIVSTEMTVGLAYRVEHRPTAANSGLRGIVALVTFFEPCAYLFGAPNQDGLAAHPLAARGLRAHGAFSVTNSSWVRALERLNSVSDRRPERLQMLRHFVLTFQDSTFECAAAAFEFDLAEGTLSSVMPELLHRVGLDASGG